MLMFILSFVYFSNQCFIIFYILKSSNNYFDLSSTRISSFLPHLSHIQLLFCTHKRQQSMWKLKLRNEVTGLNRNVIKMG